MSMENARENGFRKGLKFNCGVFIGFTVVLILSCVFSRLLYKLIPGIEPYMLLVGAAYILYLAWTVWRDKPHGHKRSKLPLNSVLTGALLQLINPKAIMYAITTYSDYILPHYQSPMILGAFAVALAGVAFLCTCLWALFASGFERLFVQHKKAVNAVMVLLLLYCAWTLLWPAIQAFQAM